MRDRHLLDAVELDGRLAQERRHEVHAQDTDRHAGTARDRAGEHAFRRLESVGRREVDGRWQRADRR